MRKLWYLFLILTIGLLTEVDSVARDLSISAERMEVIEDEGLAVFSGKVFAEERDFKLWADKLYLYYAKTANRRDVQRGLAVGRVKVEKGKWKASAGKATYFKLEEKLVLEDQPKVWYENHVVEGDVIVVYFNEDRSEVLSQGGRVRAVIRR